MNRNKNINHPLLLAFCFAACLLIGGDANAQINDWTVVISAQRQDQLLNYPGSKLPPLIKTPVNYFQTADTQVHYQDLYYSHCQVVGLRQYHMLDITPGSSIIIRINNLGQDPEEGCAVANAAVRVYMDLYLTRTILLYVAVPKGTFDNLIAGLQNSGFYPIETSAQNPERVVTVLRVMSDPPGRTEEMVYLQ